MTYEVMAMRRFLRAYKKLHANQVEVVDDQIAALARNPELGQSKRGDLAGVRVHKFKVRTTEFLLGYSVDEGLRLLYLEALGSLSADTMAGIAPVELSVGAELRIGDVVDGSPSDLIAPHITRSEILLLPGPHLDRLPDDALSTLTSTEWVVENNSRVGVRLTGRALNLPAQSASGQSEPMIVGALQIPPSGYPIILGRDHPVTGGYPVAAVIDDSGISEALGASVGSVLRFQLK